MISDKTYSKVYRNVKSIRRSMEQLAMATRKKYTANSGTFSLSSAGQKIFFLAILSVTLHMVVNGENVENYGPSGGLQSHDHKHCKHQHPKAHEVSAPFYPLGSVPSIGYALTFRFLYSWLWIPALL